MGSPKVRRAAGATPTKLLVVSREMSAQPTSKCQSRLIGRAAVLAAVAVFWPGCRDEPGHGDAGADAGGSPSGCAAVVAAGTVPGRFTDLTTQVESALPRVPPAPPFGDGVLSVGAIGDVDGDGATDVLLGAIADPAGSVGFRYDAATRSLAPLPGPWPIIRGILDLDGDGRDELIGMDIPPTVRWGGASAYQPLLSTTARHPMSAMWFDDLDHDGWIDLLVSNDSERACGSNSTVRAFLQSAPRLFEERANLIPSRAKVGDGPIISGPLGGRRVVGVVGDSHQCDTPLFFEEGALDAEAYPTYQPVRLVNESVGGPMGAFIGDLDQDGAFDLAVSTDPSLMLWRGGAAPLGLVPNSGGMGMLLGMRGQPQKPWGVALLDLDRDGRLDAVVTHGNHHVLESEAPIGPQWTSVYLHGDGEFCMNEVDGALGLDRAGDWRSLAVGDLDLDGHPDLVVGGRGFSPRVYRNDIAGGHRGLALRLRGTTSNAPGIGAEVEVRATPTGRVQHHLVGGSAPPLVLANPLVFVGLGDAPTAAEVTIRWPSGTVQILRGLEAGRTHLVVEPPSIVTEPPSRRLPADGASVARLRVTPRDAVGGLAPGARVSARIVAGGGTLGEPTAVGDEVVVEIRAPMGRGSSVLEVSVDGRALAVRPRIWWE